MRMRSSLQRADGRRESPQVQSQRRRRHHRPSGARLPLRRASSAQQLLARHCCGRLPYLQEEMAAANIDMVSRDFCAHILIKLNECRCVAARAAAVAAARRVAANPARGAALCLPCSLTGRK